MHIKNFHAFYVHSTPLANEYYKIHGTENILEDWSSFRIYDSFFCFREWGEEKELTIYLVSTRDHETSSFYIQHISNTYVSSMNFCVRYVLPRCAFENIIEVTPMFEARTDTLDEYTISPCPNITENHFGCWKEKLKKKKKI